MSKKVMRVFMLLVVMVLFIILLLHEVVLPIQIQKANQIIKEGDHNRLEKYLQRNRLAIASWPFVSSTFDALVDRIPVSSPLATACIADDDESVHILLKYGADPNFIPMYQEKYYPIELAASRGNLQAIALLLQYGANATEQGEKVVRAYLRYRMCSLDEGGYPSLDTFEKLMDMLEHYGFTIPLDANDGFTPLEYAAIYGDIVIVRHLISEYSINANAQAYDGKTILHLYIDSGYQKANTIGVEAILAMGTDPHMKDSDGKTAYDYAIEKGYSEIAQFLSESR